jgi:hypothetical protein
MKQNSDMRVFLCSVLMAMACLFAGRCIAGTYLDNQTLYSNQDPNTETRRSDHFRLAFGHYNRDSGQGGMTEAMAQGNLQMYEQMWNRWVVEMGLHDINESVTAPDGNKYLANFNFLMTWDDGGDGGSYSAMDGNGFFYAMANPTYCRWDPPSGATPHEFGHVWEGTCAGFNDSDSSGMWWECTANWMQLQFLNTYPQAAAYLYNSMYYPAHGRDYYDSFLIWEAAHDDPRYGAAWVNSVWTNATADQSAHEYIIDRMIRLDSSGSPDKAGALKDLWGDMAKKCITQDFERQRWLAQANGADDGTNWDFYQRCRTPLVKMAGTPGWYRPERGHLPMEFGFNMIPLTTTPGTTMTCDFEPDCDPVRQSDWRACLVAVNRNGDARYSGLWNKGVQTMNVSLDETKLYLVVIATPKPMKIAEPMWTAYQTDAGLQFPYRLSFTGAAPKDVVYPRQSHSGMTQHANGGGWKANTAIVDATAWVGPNAQVLDSAQVRGHARIEEDAVVRDHAQVRDYAVVSGHALVEGYSQVYGTAKVRDWGHVYGYAEVYKNAKVIEHANCGDGSSTTHTKVHGSAILKGTTIVYDPSTLGGCLIMDGDSSNGNGTTVADHGVHFGWSWGQDPGRFSGLTDNGYIYAQHTFEKDNAVFALDQFGINHGFLMNGCRVGKDMVSPTRGGRVLPLDGVSQYVELHNSLNDFKDTAISIWAKWTGSTVDQRIWSMGDGAGKVMYLTPCDGTTGGLRFVITDGVTTQALDGMAAMPANAWTHVAVVFSGTTCTLYVNGATVATNPSMVLFPDSLNAPLMENANYLGRGNAGNYFQGYLDDFRVYMKSLSAAEVLAVYSEAAPGTVTVTPDTAAPTPNAATWLVAPNAVGDSAITMSATPGTDASGWVEYYFACTSGGGHDSGWVSFNKYTDIGLAPGSTYTYAVRMRDRTGNTTAASGAVSAATPASSVGTASFAYGPIGVSSSAVTMSATRVTNASGQTEFLFSRTGKSSGWQSSPTWTDSGLASGSVYSYTVQMRDAHGNIGPASAESVATATDTAAPILPRSYAQWYMLPYATIDNRVSMTAQTPTTSDSTGLQYLFHCTSGNAPDSAWQSSATYLTTALADGTYTYAYKVRDGAKNESPYSAGYSATITPTSGYHACTFSSLATLPDDDLVTFNGTVINITAVGYVVRDTAGAATIAVKPNTYGQATDASMAFKNVMVSGHLYTLAGKRVVTYAILTVAGAPAYSISGKVTKTGGAAVPGATVYFSTSPNASVNPNGTATTDASGDYSMPIVNGTWYVCAGGTAYNTSADRVVVMNSANVPGTDFTLTIKPSISGKVTNSSGTAISGATVCFSTRADAAANPAYTVSTDASGNYAQVVPAGVWYVCAGAKNYQITVDQVVNADGTIGNVNFTLPAPAPRAVPRSDQLLFSAVTDVFPVTGPTGDWATYLPSGQTLAATASPTVQVSNRVRWENNNRITTSDGYTLARYAAAIPVNGVTIVAAVRPAYCNPGGEARGEIVDIFYDRLALAISHADGRVMVARNYWNDWGPAIPNGQRTVLSLVVQTNGSYRVYANGTQIMAGAANGTWTSINPDHTATWGSDPDYTHYISVGRNSPDGWSAYNGNIGDVFVYKVALTDAERGLLESDLMARFGIGGPFTLVDAARAMSVWAGLQTASTADAIRLNAKTAGASISAIDGLDAVRIARKVAGLEPNP